MMVQFADYAIPQSARTNCGAHPPSYSMCTECSFPWGKTAGALERSIIPSSTEARNAWNYSSRSPWRVVTRAYKNFTFTSHRFPHLVCSTHRSRQPWLILDHCRVVGWDAHSGKTRGWSCRKMLPCGSIHRPLVTLRSSMSPVEKPTSFHRPNYFTITSRTAQHYCITARRSSAFMFLGHVYANTIQHLLNLVHIQAGGSLYLPGFSFLHVLPEKRTLITTPEMYFIIWITAQKKPAYTANPNYMGAQFLNCRSSGFDKFI
jgi:hypothetical protein